MSNVYAGTAGTPTHRLMYALEAAGWGDLAGRDLAATRVILWALSRILPGDSAAGLSTAEQIAARAGYSERWTRHCLHNLEEVGVVTWHRGGITEGRPDPSHFRIDKKALVALIGLARVAREKALTVIRARTDARIAGLRVQTLRSKHRKARSIHAEVSSSLPPHGEDSLPPPDASPPSADASSFISAARAAIAAARHAMVAA